jgi:hypothetical protein
MLKISDRAHVLLPTWYAVGAPLGTVLADRPRDSVLTVTIDGVTSLDLQGAEALLWAGAWEHGGLQGLASDFPSSLAAGVRQLEARGMLVAWPPLTQPWPLWAIGLTAAPRDGFDHPLPEPAATMFRDLATDPVLLHHPLAFSDHLDRDRWCLHALGPLLGRAVVLYRPDLGVE